MFKINKGFLRLEAQSIFLTVIHEMSLIFSREHYSELLELIFT